MVAIAGTLLTAEGGSQERSRWCFLCTPWLSLRLWPAHSARSSLLDNRKSRSPPLSTQVSSHLERVQRGRREDVETKRRRIAAEPRFAGRRHGQGYAHVVRLVVGHPSCSAGWDSGVRNSRVVLRVSGERTLAKLNAFDFLVTVALVSTLATILLSSTVLFTEGALALAAFAGCSSWSQARRPAEGACTYGPSMN